MTASEAVRIANAKEGTKEKDYVIYISMHCDFVKTGFHWMETHGLIQFLVDHEGLNKTQLITNITDHDASKWSDEEFDAYATYFFAPEGKTNPESVRNFNRAWLHHIHANPHHWQYWLIPKVEEENMAIEMPIEYIVEMICDWWAFSWKSNNLYEIFSWYKKQKILLAPKTKSIVENILAMLETALHKAGF